MDISIFEIELSREELLRAVSATIPPVRLLELAAELGIPTTRLNREAARLVTLLTSVSSGSSSGSGEGEGEEPYPAPEGWTPPTSNHVKEGPVFIWPEEGFAGVYCNRRWILTNFPSHSETK